MLEKMAGLLKLNFSIKFDVILKDRKWDQKGSNLDRFDLDNGSLKFLKII